MSFSKLYRRLFPAIARLARSITIYSSHIDEDDILQEMRIRLWREYLRGALEDKTDSYIMQNLWFHAKNYLRKNKVKLKTISLDAIRDEDGLPLCDLIADYKSDNITGRVTSRIVIDKISRRLNPRQRAVFELRRRGHTLREVAKKLRISHVQVYKIEKNIRRRCKDIRWE